MRSVLLSNRRDANGSRSFMSGNTTPVSLASPKRSWRSTFRSYAVQHYCRSLSVLVNAVSDVCTFIRAQSLSTVAMRCERPVSPFVFSASTVTKGQFMRAWCYGAPVVVTGMQEHLQGRWTPDDFLRDHPNIQVEVLDCDSASPDPQVWTAADFFTTLGSPIKTTSRIKVKVIPILVITVVAPYETIALGLSP